MSTGVESIARLRALGTRGIHHTPKDDDVEAMVMAMAPTPLPAAAAAAAAAADAPPTCDKCGGTAFVSKDAFLTCTGCGTVGRPDPEAEGTRTRFVDGDLVKDGHGVETAMGGGHNIGRVVVRGGTAMERSAKSAKMKSATKALRTASGKVRRGGRSKSGAQAYEACAQALRRRLAALPHIPADVAAAVQKLCNGSVCQLRVIHRRHTEVGMAALLFIAMRACHKPECVKSILIRLCGRMCPQGRVVYDSRHPHGVFLSSGNHGGGRSRMTPAESIRAAMTCQVDKLPVQEGAVENLRRALCMSMKKYSLIKSPSDEALVPKKAAKGDARRYAEMVKRAREAHAIYYAGLYQPREEYYTDLLRRILYVPTLGSDQWDSVWAVAIDVKKAMEPVKAGHNMDHRAGILACLLLRHLFCFPRVSDTCIARVCKTSVDTINRKTREIINSTSMDTVAAVADARAAFEARFPRGASS